MKFWIICIVTLLSACTSRTEKATTLAHDAGWQWDIISAGAFDLATAHPPEQHGDTLWVYIEGDGFAFVSPSQPALDPTPTDPLALRLALAQPYTAPVAYLARPCQYMPRHARSCSNAYWTNARYSSEVVDSTNQALDQLKATTGATKLVLVGYSGGGAVAVLTAARRHDVVGIVTVAANLDLAYWTGRDNLTPLTGSLDPADVASAVATIPQVHFTGGHDKAVGTDVARAFVKHLPANAPVQIIEEPDFTHQCCWAQKWPQLIEELK